MFEPGKLIVISLSNRPGGTEQCLRMIAAAGRGQIIYIQKDDAYRIEPFNGYTPQFITKGSMLLGFLMLIPRLAKYRNKGYTILSSAVYLNGWLGILKRIGYLKSELIFRESTTIFSRFKGIKRITYELLYRLGYPAAGLVICQTDAMRNEFIKYVNFIPRGSVVTLPNPIELGKVTAKAEQDDLPELNNFVCAAGRLIGVKGFDYLIKAFHAIAAEYKGLKLVILGEGPDQTNLMQLIRALNMQKQIILKGFVENPYPYFKKARVCIVSSTKEGFPNVLLQMMALNDTVVSTLCAGGIQDIPGVIKVKPGNVEALSAGLTGGLRLIDLGNRRALFDQYLFDRSPEVFVESLREQFVIPLMPLKVEKS